VKILTDENTSYYKSVLENLITPYYDRRKEVYGIIGQAIRDAMDDVGKQILRKEIADLREQIKLINDNSASPGFLVDLAITAILGPVGGHLAVGLTGRFVRSMVKNRKRNLAIAKKTMNDRENFGALLLTLTDPTAHAKKRNQKVNDNLVKKISEWADMKELHERATTIQEYVDYYSPAGCDIIQALLPKMAEKFLSKKETSSALNSIYNKTDIEKNPDNRQDILTTLTNIRNAYTHYSRPLSFLLMCCIVNPFSINLFSILTHRKMTLMHHYLTP
jgi:hypothetical protein